MRASGGLYQPAKHIWWLGDLLLKLFSGEITRLLVSFPPRHSKSETISKYLPTWWLGKRPSDRIIACSYGESLTRQWSAASRDILAEHGGVFGVDTNVRAKGTDWRVYKNGRQLGGLFGVGKGGALTGRGADLLIIDDLVKDPDDVNTLNQRDRTWQWFQSVPMTRLQPGARIVAIGTRWHHDDYLGRIIAGEAGDGWVVANLPALADGEDPLGRAPGEPLWPEFWGEGDTQKGLEWYHKRRDETDPYTWSALYQGHPTPAEGGMFKAEWLRTFVEEDGYLSGMGASVHRDGLAVFASLDLAFSKKTSADYTVCCVWGSHLPTGNLFLLHLERERVGAEGLAHWIRGLFAAHGVKRGHVERSGFYADITRHLIREGLPLVEVQPNKDKVSRAQPTAALMASGGFYVRDRSPWLPDFQSELLQFPHGAHDDQVDAVSLGVSVHNEMKPSARMERYEVDSRWAGRRRGSWL